MIKTDPTTLYATLGRLDSKTSRSNQANGFQSMVSHSIQSKIDDVKKLEQQDKQGLLEEGNELSSVIALNTLSTRIDELTVVVKKCLEEYKQIVNMPV